MYVCLSYINQVRKAHAADGLSQGDTGKSQHRKDVMRNRPGKVASVKPVLESK